MVSALTTGARSYKVMNVKEKKETEKAKKVLDEEDDYLLSHVPSFKMMRGKYRT